MSQLTPCPRCHRHIRVSSAVCPFCDAATLPAELNQTRAARRAPIQKGVKRAVLFAIGAGLTQAACADGEADEPDTTEMEQPVYGAPVTDAGSTSHTSPSDTTELAQPVYGAPITDATTSFNTTDDGNQTFQPVYGAPLVPDASTVVDAGAADASADAADVDASVETSEADDSDTTELAQPVYGAPIDTTDATGVESTSTKSDVGPTWNDRDGGGLIVPLYGAIPAQNE